MISFRVDWFDLLIVQGTLKSLLQHHSSKASILQCSAFFIVQLSHPYMTKPSWRSLASLEEIRSLWQRHGSAVACCRVGGTEYSVVCMGPFEGGHHYLHYLHHSLASGQITGRKPCPSTENWIKDLLSMALPIRTRPSFPLSQSLPSESFHKPLILLHQRADRMKTTTTEN